MFNLFESKNQRLVKKWKKEHEALIVQANKVIGAYVKGEMDEAKRELKKFVDLAVEHLSDEDVKLFKMLRDAANTDEKLEKYIDEYYKSFKDTKSTLLHFLAKYVRPENPLDDEFFNTFEKIEKVLRDRINYEESNLYFYLSLS